jgi:hypothetical protein
MTTKPRLTCRSFCGDVPVDIRWHPYRAGGFHLGAYCTVCGWWIKWVPQTAVWLALVPPKPEPEAIGDRTDATAAALSRAP